MEAKLFFSQFIFSTKKKIMHWKNIHCLWQQKSWEIIKWQKMQTSGYKIYFGRLLSHILVMTICAIANHHTENRKPKMQNFKGLAIMVIWGKRAKIDVVVVRCYKGSDMMRELKYAIFLKCVLFPPVSCSTCTIWCERSIRTLCTLQNGLTYALQFINSVFFTRNQVVYE